MKTTASAGLGLKPQHFEEARSCTAPGIWFEVHPENYMVAGGPRLAWLEAIRSRHALSLHGVALSLAADSEPDAAHLDRLAQLVARLEPVRISEHLAWSTWRGGYFPDLLPVPRTREVLLRVVDNLDRVQERLRRPLALENPSHYLTFEQHACDEVDFLVEIARRSGCSLLLDVNNVYVSARNLGYCAEDVIDAIPGALVDEIHLAGHSPDPTLGERLLIDSHDAPVAPAVWALYERLMARIGPRPTLIERDGDIPSFDALLAERTHAESLMIAEVAVAA